MLKLSKRIVDLSKFYFTHHEVGSLHSQESRELQNKGKRLQVGNKEEALSLCWLAGVAYLTLFHKFKKQGNKYRAQGWLGGWRLAN